MARPSTRMMAAGIAVPLLGLLAVLVFTFFLPQRPAPPVTPADPPTPVDVERMNRELDSVLPRASAEELDQLVTEEEDDSLAVAAAWQRVVRATHPVMTREHQIADGPALEEFFEVIEGRLQLELPAWWKESLRHTEISPTRRDMDRIRVSPLDQDLNPHHWVGGRHNVLKGHDIHWTEEGGLLITDGTRSYALPEALTGGLYATFLLATTRGVHVIAAHHPRAPYRMPLLVRETATGETRWQRLVLATRTIYGGGGFGGMQPNIWSTLQIHDGRVVFIGASYRAVFIECFDLTTGDAVFRFSTMYRELGLGHNDLRMWYDVPFD